MHWPDPAQRARIAEIRDNLIARIAEADREGWLGETEGLKISLVGAQDKLAQIDRRTHTTTVDLGIPAFTRKRRPALNLANRDNCKIIFVVQEMPMSGRHLFSARPVRV